MVAALDDIWKALSDPTRREILDALRERPRTTGDLVDRFPRLSRFAVMKHLGVLEEAGLVLVRREGRFRFNHLNAVPIRRIHDRWVSRFASRWADALLDIKRVAESHGQPGAGEDQDEALTMSERQTRVLHVEHEIRIEAPRERVFEAITTQIGRWWPHRFRPAESSVVLEPEVGGRFYEDWGGGRGALYAHVTCLDPPSRLCTRGPMGMSGSASVVKWYVLEEDGEATVLKTTLEASGVIPDDVAERYREGSREAVVLALKPFVEEGRVFDPAA